MPPSAPHPRLPAWIFIATDVVLVAAAAFIGLNSQLPLPSGTVFTLVALVALGALAGLVPLVVAYERQKNEALDDRQRALEALARTVSESAEQISIAAAGLNGIADAAQRSARQAENLPQLLQEKVAEFQLRLGAAQDAERQELERELTRLRAGHHEKLEAAAERLVQAAAEWSKLAPVIRQQAVAAQEAITQAGGAAAAALAEAQAQAARSFAEAAATAARNLSTLTPAAASPAPAAPESTEAKAEAPAVPLAAPETPAAPEETVVVSATPAPTEAVAVAAAEPTAKAPAPKRTRRPKREEPPAAPASETATAPSDVPAPAEPVAPAPAAETQPAGAIPRAPEVAPAPKPAAPTPAEPVASAPAQKNTSAAEPAPLQAPAPPAPTAPETAPEPAPEAEKNLRRRAARKPEPQPDELPALDLDDSDSRSAASVAERVLSSDGATRVLVTAYIGIGNRVFIRGEGAGLSWDKGVPLQFVSIGKWRWENSEASSPVRFKLYKNDEIECAALGAQELQPGHQLEVTAAF
jgi:hypothetical protein